MSVFTSCCCRFLPPLIHHNHNRGDEERAASAEQLEKANNRCVCLLEGCRVMLCGVCCELMACVGDTLSVFLLQGVASST